MSTASIEGISREQIAPRHFFWPNGATKRLSIGTRASNRTFARRGADHEVTADLKDLADQRNLQDLEDLDDLLEDLKDLEDPKDLEDLKDL